MHLDCVACGSQAQQVHHIIGHGDSGMAQKADDELTIPLCAFCHNDLHSKGHETWEAKFNRTQYQMLEETDALLSILEQIS